MFCQNSLFTLKKKKKYIYIYIKPPKKVSLSFVLTDFRLSIYLAGGRT